MARNLPVIKAGCYTYGYKMNGFGHSLFAHRKMVSDCQKEIAWWKHGVRSLIRDFPRVVMGVA